MIKSYYDAKAIVPDGEKFTMPSLAVPDLSYSIKQLVQQFSVGQLPTLAELQQYIEEEEESYALDYEGMSSDNDLRFADKADAFAAILENYNLRATLKARAKQILDFGKTTKKADKAE